MDKWLQLLVTGITMGSVYALIALGFVTIYRSSRIVNMAQGSFVMFGGLFAFSMFMELGLPYWLAGHHRGHPRGDPGGHHVAGRAQARAQDLAGDDDPAAPWLSACCSRTSLSSSTAATPRQPARPSAATHTFQVGGVFISAQSLWIIGIMVVMPDRALLPQQPHHPGQADDGYRHQSDGGQPLRRQRQPG